MQLRPATRRIRKHPASHCRKRKRTRFAIRMLNGTPRPRPLDYLKLACIALEEYFKIGVRLRPIFKAEQERAERQRSYESMLPILLKVYGGPPPVEPPVVYGPEWQRKLDREYLLAEKELAKTRRVIARLKDILARDPAYRSARPLPAAN